MQDVYTREKKNENIGEKYQLRHAGGLYWLLDMEQSGASYKDPLPLNAAGAEIWEMFARGMGEDDISERLCKKYGVLKSQVLNDVHDFIMQIKTSEC